MINENKFIDSIKRYDISGLEFEPIDSINEVIAGTMRPFKKRGMELNEFTLVNVAGFEVINEDTVLNLFNAIPPGPKDMERHRTHLVVGRYSQAVMPVVIFNLKGEKYILLQKRNPINIGFAESTEIYRDYVQKDQGNHNFDAYLESRFKTILEKATQHTVTNCGYYWENTGIIGSNICVYICDIDLGASVTKNDLLSLLNTGDFTETNNVIGTRRLELITTEDLAEKYKNMVINPESTKGNHDLTDLLSINGIFCLFRYLDRQSRTHIDSIV